MKNLWKFIKIISVNIVLFVLFICLSDMLIYLKTGKTVLKNPVKCKYIFLIKYTPLLTPCRVDFFSDKERYSGRAPVGVEYKNKKPIVIFGCSYAYGKNLNKTETFGYKLSHYLKVPVYNRAIEGGSFQQMYMQTISESFFKEVPPTDTVIYVMINDHYRRMYGEAFDLDSFYLNPFYKEKNGELELANYNNYFLNFLRYSTSVRIIKCLWYKNYLNSSFNQDKITDFALLHLKKSREKLEEKWNKKINFTVVLYDDTPIKFQELLIKKLNKNGFNVIVASKLTDENLSDEKYLSSKTAHPTKEAWDLLTPLIAEKIR